MSGGLPALRESASGSPAWTLRDHSRGQTERKRSRASGGPTRNAPDTRGHAQGCRGAIRRLRRGRYLGRAATAWQSDAEDGTWLRRAGKARDISKDRGSPDRDTRRRSDMRLSGASGVVQRSSRPEASGARRAASASSSLSWSRSPIELWRHWLNRFTSPARSGWKSTWSIAASRASSLTRASE